MPREGTHLPRSIRALALTGVAVALIAAAPATAGAVSTNPTSLSFGSQPVGTTSGPQGVSLDVPCSLPVLGACPGFAVDLYYVHISTTGDFAAVSNCPNPLGPTATTVLGSCSIDVSFKPSGTGTRSGTLNTGTTDVTGLLPGPTVALTGAGTTGSPAGNSGSTGTTRKKCKKHRKHKRHGKKCRKRKKRK
jgi:hypothetical protein